MNYTINLSETCSPVIRNEEYFPLSLHFDTCIENYNYIGFYYENRDLLEILLDNEHNTLKSIMVISCQKFKVIDQVYQEPTQYSSETTIVYCNDHNNCDTLCMTIYRNAATITLSHKTPTHIVKYGSLIFSVTEDHQLAEITVLNMTNQNIEHTIFELKNP